MKFAAVVVSYNRLDLLKGCLNALEHQSRPLDEIIVVDNGSTDGSDVYVEQNYPNVTLFRTGQNLGGAGGFSWGIEIALAHGHDGAWLMDDDAKPEHDAVEPLIQRFESMEPEPAFLASLVTAGRGVFNMCNLPVISTDAEKQVEASKLGGIAIDTATFVGVMVNLHFAARTHLPLGDFFIWLDDSEYTYRLSRKGLAMTIKESQVNHPDNKPISNDMGPRLFYFARNRIWLRKERDSAFSTGLVDILGLTHHCVNQFFVAKDKLGWLRCVARGYWLGFSTRPRHMRPGALLASLTPQQRATIGC